MAHPHHLSRLGMTGPMSEGVSLQSPQSNHLSAVANIFSANQYSDSLAFWHTPNSQFSGMSLAGGQTYDPQMQPLPQVVVDQKKHKRTRSGCFTCRARRVKCDEARPVCERCRKGNRDCVYPSIPPASSSRKAGDRKTRSGGRRPSTLQSESSDTDLDESAGLRKTTPDQELHDDTEGSKSTTSRHSSSTTTPKLKPALRKAQSSRSLAKRKSKQASDTTRDEKSSSPSTEFSHSTQGRSSRATSISHSGSGTLSPTGSGRLPEDLQFYINFHQEYLTYHHFFLPRSGSPFVKQWIIESAMHYEPLLYALVGFAAYHHSLQAHSGKLSTFLKYYSTAVTLLRKSLGSGEPHTEATLITVLVLATFEEYIGDWVSLIDHHQAANALTLELMTVDSINLSDLHKNIFHWYARFDVIVGILGGNETILNRDWYISKELFDTEQANMHPDSLEKQLTLACSLNRRFGLDLASLNAKLSHGIISLEEFAIQNKQLAQTLERMRNVLMKYDGSKYTVQSYPHLQPLTEDDIFDPYVPGGLHQRLYFDINFVWIDWLATSTMFKYQTSMALQQTPASEIQSQALELARLMEAIDRWPMKDNGHMIAFKNSLGCACMFVPQTEKNIMWCRRKIVQMEQNGYIYSPKFRAELAALWGKPELNHWWLPNDEGYPEIIREVRAMTQERVTNPRDNFREDVRDMKSLFRKMNMDDTTSDSSPNSSRSGNV